MDQIEKTFKNPKLITRNPVVLRERVNESIKGGSKVTLKHLSKTRIRTSN